MKTITASMAKDNLDRLIEEAAESSEPVRITGERTNAVLISEQDWRALQETMYLLSIPGMRESIREGLETPVEECDEPGCRPIAKLVRMENEPRRPGYLKGQIHMADDFDSPLPDESGKGFED
jgi:antitoxin YefM